MELYNFFTEVISTNEPERFENLKLAHDELKNHPHAHCYLVPFTGLTGEQRYSIVGQIYGEDTNGGDTDLASVMIGIKYTWLDAYCTVINNIYEDIF